MNLLSPQSKKQHLGQGPPPASLPSSVSVYLCASSSPPGLLLGPSPAPFPSLSPTLFPWELGGWGRGLHIQAGAIVQQSVFVFILLAGGRRGAKG